MAVELALTAGGAEPVVGAVAAGVVLRVVDEHRHAAHRVDRFARGRPRVVSRGAGRRRGAPRGRRAPRPRSRRCRPRRGRARPARAPARAVRRSIPSLAQHLHERRRPLLRGDDAEVAGVGRERGSQREVVVVTLRRDDDRGRRADPEVRQVEGRRARARGAGARSRRPPSSITATSQSSARAWIVSACTAGERPTTTSCGRGEERLDVHLAARLRCRTPSATVIVPSSVVVGRARRAGRGTTSRGSPSPSAPSASRTTVGSAHAPPSQPCTVPSSRTIALRPQVPGARGAPPHHRRERERADAPASSSTASARTPASISPWTPAPTRSPTRRGRGAAACRCCARRGARARRSPR